MPNSFHTSTATHQIIKEAENHGITQEAVIGWAREAHSVENPPTLAERILRHIISSTPMDELGNDFSPSRKEAPFLANLTALQIVKIARYWAPEYRTFRVFRNGATEEKIFHAY